MTRAKAVALLRKYIREEVFTFVDYENSYEWRREFYKRFMAEWLCERILQSDEDPFIFIRNTYYMLDDILSESDDDQFQLHIYCNYMENAVGDILRFFTLSRAARDVGKENN